MGHARLLSPAGELRVQLGLAVQPFVSALLGSVLSFALTGAPLEAAIALGVFIGIAGVLVTICCAYPTFMWLLKRGPVSRGQVLMSGALFGNIPTALMVLALATHRLRQGQIPDLIQLTDGPVGAVRIVAIGSCIGVGSAAVFWWLTRRHIDVERRAIADTADRVNPEATY